MSDIQDLPEYLSNCLSNALGSAGIDADLARSIVESVDHDIRREFGGERHYVPVPDKKRRNQLIIADWKEGVPKTEIAKKHDITVKTVNTVISNHLQRIRPRQQRLGFGSEEWSL